MKLRIGGGAGAFQKNFCSRTSLLVNLPFTDSAVELAKKECFFDKVGLHLNLYEFSPLTRNIIELKNYSDGNVFCTEAQNTVDYCRDMLASYERKLKHK